MKKQFFHKNLYKDQLKQLRLLGFISLGLLSLIAVLIPIGMAISASRRALEMGNIIRKISPNVIGFHFYLFFIFTLLVPLLTLFCFHYLTQRNSSDFYHSLPHTRTCLFNCNIAAVFTWTTLLVWVPTILSIIMYTIFKQYFILDIPSLLRFALLIYLASLLVMASISIACSITGTVFTNVVVAGMIIFLPRIFILVVSYLITGASEVLVSNHLFPLLDYQNNAVFGLLSYITGSTAFLGWGTMLYTIVLTVLYLVLGLLVYKRRRSEAASQAAVSKKVQIIIRLLLGTTVSLFPISIIFDIITGNQTMDSSELPFLIYAVGVLYLIACVVMLLYELLTTKKFRNVIKALPSIGYLAIINVIIILASFGIFKLAMSYSPDAKDIDYIVMEQSFENLDTLYYDTLANSIQIKDPKTLELVAKCLKDSLERNKHEFWTGDANIAVIGIHSGLTTHYRKIIFSMEDYQALLKSYENSQEYKDAYQVLPELSGTKLSLNRLNLSNNEYLELYNVAREEIKSLSFKDWYMTITGDIYSGLDNLTFYATVNNRSLSGSIPINGMLPKTCKKYLELADNHMKKDQSTIITEMKSMLANEKEDDNNLYIYFEIIDVAENNRWDFDYSFNDLKEGHSESTTLATNRSLLENLISNTKDFTTFDPTKDYAVRANYQRYDDVTDINTQASCIFIIEKTKLEFLINHLGKDAQPDPMMDPEEAEAIYNN